MATPATSSALPAPPPGAEPRALAEAFAEGFHGPETEQGQAFRWMAAQARLRLPASEAPSYVELWVRCHFSDLGQKLTVTAGDGVSETLELTYGWNALSVALPPGAPWLQLEADRLFPQESHPGDGRELALQVRPPVVHADLARHERAAERHARSVRHLREMLASPLAAYLAAAREVRYGAGFHSHEVDDGLPVRWMERRGRLAFPSQAAGRFLELWVRSPFPDLAQRLRFSAGPGPAADFVLAPGWNTVSVALPDGCAGLVLDASAPLPAEEHPRDVRELAVQVRSPLLHGEGARHEHVLRQQRNRVLNFEELLAGALELRSTPPKLGIDLTGVCNIKPPCVYCAWDLSKEREGGNVDLPFNLDTLAEYGAFFENSTELVNCSIGEPFMMKDVDPLLDAFGGRGKILELTTNGQILTDTNIRKLLGRNVHLYVSLDASTPATYAKLRNARFQQVLDNLRRLIEAKGGPGHLPLVYAVFMPMRANVHEAADFVALCADLRVDRLVLRPLNASEGLELRWDRAGYQYDYQKELLPFEELVRVSGRVAELARRLDVELSDQMDFGGELGPGFAEAYEAGRREAVALLEAAPARPPSDRSDSPALLAPPPADPGPAPEGLEPPPAIFDPPAPGTVGRKLPICTEPWTSLYVLRRGTLPCCYGGASVASMQGFQGAWNSPLLQDIRKELRAGRFHRYCFDSPDCPLVRKAEEHRDLSAPQALLLGGVRWLTRLKRAGFGLPGRLYRGAKRLVRGPRQP